MGIIDRMISIFSPKTAFNRARYRAAATILGSSSYSGASKTKRSMKGWGLRSSISPDDEILSELETLRDRSRDLYKNNPVATGAIKKMVTNVVGTGLRLQARVEREFLGLSDDAADSWESDVERRFRSWAESQDVDAGRRLNFYEIQELAFLSILQSGEVFALLPLIPRPGSSSDLRVQLIEADRVSNPDDSMDTDKISGGIEVGKYGEPVAYHVITSSPGALFAGQKEWQRVSAFGSGSGRQNVLHIYKQERPGQRRGVPFLTTVVETLKQLGRYTESELMAAVVSSMFTVFVKSQTGNTDVLGAALPVDERVEVEGGNYELAPGAIVGLAEGEDVQIANPGRPNAAFDVFVTALLRQVGMALEIPYELLVQHFQASYSASRAALLEAWKVFRARRLWLSQKLCKPIYEEWLTEEVLAGRVQAPGFFDDVEIKRAYCGAEWVGPAPGQIDPVKETTAAEMRVKSGFSTLSEETASIVGGDWERKIRQRAKENRLMIELGLVSDGSDNVQNGGFNDAQNEDV